MFFQMDYELVGWEKFSRRELNDIIRQSLRELGLHWRIKYLPLHFGKSASTRYGYGPRKGEPGSGRSFRGSYTSYKLKRKGHTRPLEWSGESKRLAMFGSGPVRATAKGGANGEASVTVPIKAFNIRNPKSKTHPQNEIRATRPDELVAMADFLVAQIERRFAQSHGGSAFVALRTS